MSWLNIAALPGNLKYWYDTEVWGGTRWRAKPSNFTSSDFIPEVWSDDTIQTLGLMKALMILVSPNYTHKWRRGFNWWHRRCCYDCALARLMWPEAKRRLRSALVPMERDLPELPHDKARRWVEREVASLGTPIVFKPSGIYVWNKTPRGFQ